jgi:glucose/arabinose dehydrogenase
VRRLWLLLATSAIAACGGSAPAPPVVTPPSGPETITGSERIGWDQPAADAVELAAIRYAIYVDGTRTEAAGVTCATTATAAGFACTARLPPLTRGSHTLQLASFVNDGSLLESTRSTALPVNVVAAVETESSSALARRSSPGSSESSSALARRSSPGSSSSEGAKASVFAEATADKSGERADERRLELVADGLADATDLGFAPDGRLFVAERSGHIVVFGVGPPVQGRRAGRPERAPLHARAQRADTELLALAIDPQFARTHFVFAIYTERDRDQAPAFTLARVRESGGTLADEAVLLDRIPASASPHAALRFGAEGSLYAAFDAGGDARRSDDLGSFNGKLLRLNTDGTTPRDQPSATPVVSAGLFAPAGAGWIAGSRDPWVADRRADGSAQLREAGGSHRAYRLPDGITPSSLVGLRAGDLLIASADAGALLRVRFDGTQPIGTERVALTDADGIRALTVAPDGTLYAATPTRIWRVGVEW